MRGGTPGCRRCGSVTRRWAVWMRRGGAAHWASAAARPMGRLRYSPWTTRPRSWVRQSSVARWRAGWCRLSTWHAARMTRRRYGSPGCTSWAGLPARREKLLSTGSRRVGRRHWRGVAQLYSASTGVCWSPGSASARGRSTSGPTWGTAVHCSRHSRDRRWRCSSGYRRGRSAR